MATSRAKAISWVASTIVMPGSARSRTIVEHLADQLGVERRGDLVEQQQRRVGAQRPDQRGPLLLAAGEPVGVLVGLVGQAEPAEQLARPGLGLGAASAVHPARRQRAVVEHGQVREQVVGLEDHPDPAADRARVDARVGDLLALERDDAVVDVLEQVQAAQQRRLARAGRADQADHVVRAATSRSTSSRTTLVAVRLAEVLDLAAARVIGHRAALPRAASSRRPSQSVSRASGIVSATKKPATTTSGV